ncbi:hypothetical protein POM88_036300 [Heracleum sosnowskyi]|uniref:DNA (cytosine-5-)-methyltransferase n=1 Tax=Heracleum sosnowskyi TaxID=360622 RepID=A0AAD8HNZ1_9APIA|nr:hypothetical protein POM88_036300 [Heracleum sosnowskyi]
MTFSKMEGSNSTISSESNDIHKDVGIKKPIEMKLMDLFSGCGVMSTELCLGANMTGVTLVTKWAVDLNEYAYESLKYNHPEIEVRNEKVEEFLTFLKEWESLCSLFLLIGDKSHQKHISPPEMDNIEEDEEEEVDNEEIFEIRRKGYGEDGDTLELEDGLCGAKDKLQEFLTDGFNSMILLLSGDVDVICGGFLGRYALARLVGMNYQARLGMMVAGAYGLPLLVSYACVWGAHHIIKSPQYPLPTHNVVLRGHSPLELESNVVTYDEGSAPELKNKLFLGDAISDFSRMENNESRDEMPYNSEPRTEFQKFIRSSKEVMPGLTTGQQNSVLYDHRPLKLNNDDYQRVCQIPVRKGANFRDLKGVRVRADNKVEWDLTVDREYLPSKKPLVPDYAMPFMRGTSSKPFGRLWWDETVPIVVTKAEPHN